MSDYSEYQDRADGTTDGKHSKKSGQHRAPGPGGDQGAAGGSSGCMIAALPPLTVGIVTAVLIRTRRR
ncbi:hypothetical protein LHJ74_14845 [Streptomyces sp. N2-109]|uniref:Uncharacterized protein n=1 Tax=Streptomyces gossypii TaxID=2883101 RepID=A0ABT2JTG2_9ACTN|nr:hypothetical protein [Streptomyces gossypii]MCT2591170.1 hypothetical protein [Streptomyces gossypii]